MIPIYEGTSQPGELGYSWDQFKTRFQEICNEHHEQQRALAFAFVLHDAFNPSVTKVLEDKDYWKALDKLSGKLLTVFSFTQRLPDEGPENAPHARDVLTEQFGMGDDVKLPVIVFFQPTAQGINHCLVTLKAAGIEDTFNEIRSILMTATDSISQVTSENRKNHVEIFHLIEAAIKDAPTSARLWQGLHTLRTLGELYVLMRGFF